MGCSRSRCSSSFVLAAIALGARGRFLPAGFCGALGAFTYPTGALVTVPLAVEVAFGAGRTPPQRMAGFLLGPGVAALGLLASLALYHVQVGRWNSYLSYHERFGQGLYSPLTVLAGHLRPLVPPRASPETLVAGQTAVATALLFAAAVVLWRQRERMRPLDLALLSYGGVVWIFVHVAGPGVSIYRQAAALVCLVPLLARLRPALLAGLLLLLLPVAIGMAVLFFRDVLV